MIVYGDLRSGNCLKVKYTADKLGLAYEWQDIDILSGENRTPTFLAKSDMAQVPVVEFDDGRTLAQSNAIIRYLARGSSLLPDDPFTQARIDELLFWEQYSHEPYIAVARFQLVYLHKSEAELDQRSVRRGNEALDFMEGRLTGRVWLVGDHMSVADISLLAYTRLSHEGGFDLASRPAVRAWIAACETELGIQSAG